MKTEKELLELVGKYGWNWICVNENLPEEFIEKHKDLVDWCLIVAYQNISEEFVGKYINKIHWTWYLHCRNISKEFIEKHKDKLPRFIINQNTTIRANDNVIKNLLYHFKVKEDEGGKYVLGFKKVRNNLCSVTLPWFQYEIGKVAEDWRCDCSLEKDDSFGLSCFDTIEKAVEFGGKFYGKVLQVKVYLKDIDAVVQNGEKIRCWKQIVLREIVINHESDGADGMRRVYEIEQGGQTISMNIWNEIE